MALAGQSGIVFNALADQSFQEISSRTALSVMLVGPDFEYVNIVALKSQADEPPVFPAVLLSTTHEALENGDLYQDVDEFLVIPCSAAKLDKRIKRLAQKGQCSELSTQLRVGNIVLDLNAYQVVVEGRRVDLAWMEFKLLKFLMQN